VIQDCNLQKKWYKLKEKKELIDFVETENKIFVIFELPGYFKEDINLIVAKRNIEIKIKKKTLKKYKVIYPKNCFREGQ